MTRVNFAASPLLGIRRVKPIQLQDENDPAFQQAHQQYLDAKRTLKRRLKKSIKLKINVKIYSTFSHFQPIVNFV